MGDGGIEKSHPCKLGIITFIPLLSTLLDVR